MAVYVAWFLIIQCKVNHMNNVEVLEFVHGDSTDAVITGNVISKSIRTCSFKLMLLSIESPYSTYRTSTAFTNS